MGACSSGNDHSGVATSNVIGESESFYLRLIELIEMASKNGEMSDELMREIFSVYDEKLLSDSGPNSLNPFMECVKVHQDLLWIIKKAPKEIVQNFRYLQDDFLSELQMLKKCKMNKYHDCLTASRMLENAYLKFLLFHFSQNKDFYDKRIAEAIKNDSFSPAIAAALHLKIFGISPQRLIEAPKIRFLRKNPGKILRLWLTGCCRTVYMEFLYVDERGEIHKTFFPQQCKNKCVIADDSSRIAILAAEGSKFFGWNENKSTIEFSTINGITYFKFDLKNMKWIEIEAGGH
jgi:hypothetical protein